MANNCKNHITIVCSPSDYERMRTTAALPPPADPEWDDGTYADDLMTTEPMTRIVGGDLGVRWVAQSMNTLGMSTLDHVVATWECLSPWGPPDDFLLRLTWAYPETLAICSFFVCEGDLVGGRLVAWKGGVHSVGGYCSRGGDEWPAVEYPEDTDWETFVSIPSTMGLWHSGHRSYIADLLTGEGAPGRGLGGWEPFRRDTFIRELVGCGRDWYQMAPAFEPPKPETGEETATP